MAYPWIDGQTLTAADLNAAILSALNGTIAQPASGHFYQDAGATVDRLERVLAGAAADNLAQSTRDTSPTDWLSTVMAATPIGAWATHAAQSASIARYGTIGMLSASRSSDGVAAASMLGYTPASIGHAAWGVADSVETAWANYAEAWALAGDSGQAFGYEINAVKFGSTPTPVPTPFAVNVGGSAGAYRAASGGGQTSGVTHATTAIDVVSNTESFLVGLLFGFDALAGTVGDGTGFGTAISMAPGHGLVWCTPETVGGVKGSQPGLTIYSQVTLTAQASRIVAENGSVSFTGATGANTFSVATTGTPTNTLQVQSGAETQAAGLYVQSGTGGSPNLLLSPEASGNLMVNNQALVAAGASFPSGAPGFGWLRLEVYDAAAATWRDARVPLFNPTQAGG